MMTEESSSSRIETNASLAKAGKEEVSRAILASDRTKEPSYAEYTECVLPDKSSGRQEDMEPKTSTHTHTHKSLLIL
jgi:hypothetical protein